MCLRVYLDVQGGLVGEDIYLIGERVTRLLHRIKKWTHLASTPAADRKLGILLYGFPPGVGAVGTAALLNVPESLEQTLKALRDQVLALSCFVRLFLQFTTRPMLPAVPGPLTSQLRRHVLAERMHLARLYSGLACTMCKCVSAPVGI